MRLAHHTRRPEPKTWWAVGRVLSLVVSSTDPADGPARAVAGAPAGGTMPLDRLGGHTAGGGASVARRVRRAGHRHRAHAKGALYAFGGTGTAPAAGFRGSRRGGARLGQPARYHRLRHRKRDRPAELRRNRRHRPGTWRAGGPARQPGRRRDDAARDAAGRRPPQPERATPVLGVNLGRLFGFLPRSTWPNCPGALSTIDNTEFTVEPRIAIDATLPNGLEVPGFNDVAVVRSPGHPARPRCDLGEHQRPPIRALRRGRGHRRDAHRLDRVQLFRGRPDRLPAVDAPARRRGRALHLQPGR